MHTDPAYLLDSGLPLDPGMKLDSGAVVKWRDESCPTDWVSIKQLMESGAPVSEVARIYKISEGTIQNKATKEQWMTPTRASRLRKAIEKRQHSALIATGKVRPIEEVKKEIWGDRAERFKEQTHKIVEQALKALASNPEKIHDLITGAKDLAQVVEVGRKTMGLDAADKEDNRPRMAVNIALLSGGVVDASVEEVRSASILEASMTIQDDG